MKIKHLLLAGLFCTMWGCGSMEKKINYAELSDDDRKHVADSLAQAFIITDGHVDLPYRLRVKNFRLEREYLGIPVRTAEGDFDYERAKAGGLDAPFMSIYIPSSYQSSADYGKSLADSLIVMVEGNCSSSP